MIIVVGNHHVEVVLHRRGSELTSHFLQLSPLLCSCLGPGRVVHSSCAQRYGAQLCLASPSSLLNMSRTTQMEGCMLRPILLTEFHDSDLLLHPSSPLITWSYLFQRLMSNLAFLLGPSGFLAFFDPSQVDSKNLTTSQSELC